MDDMVDIMCTIQKGLKRINRVNTMTTIETISWSKTFWLLNKVVEGVEVEKCLLKRKCGENQQL